MMSCEKKKNVTSISFWEFLVIMSIQQMPEILYGENNSFPANGLMKTVLFQGEIFVDQKIMKLIFAAMSFQHCTDSSCKIT